MRKILAILLLVSLPALADGSYDSDSTAQILAGVVPTDGSSEGLSLINAVGYYVIVSAPAGQTISGGTAVCYHENVVLNRWMLCGSAFNLTLQTGVRDSPSAGFTVPVSLGRVYYKMSSVSLSGAGTTVTVTISAKRL